MTDKKWKSIQIFLLAASVLATLKIIFFDYTLDEEYQIVMAYRNLLGDQLFQEMWEPHQTSAFMCIGLMWFYHIITGTYTGVVIFLRVCTTIIQAVLAIWGYRVFKNYTKKEYAYLLSILFFHFVPKNIQIPEFSNMQVWFFVIMVFSLMEYYQRIKREEAKKNALKGWLILSGLGMALEILAYPSCLMLFPFFVIYIGILSGKERLKDCAIYIGTCILSGLAWLAFILRNLSFDEFIRNVKCIFQFDLTHEISGATDGKMEGIISNLIGGILMLALISLISAGIFLFINWVRKKKGCEKKESGIFQMQFLTVFVCVAEAMQLFFWIVLQTGFEFPHIHVVAIFLAAILVWKKWKEYGSIMAAGIIGTILSYVAVIYISDLKMYNALPHGVLGIILCLLVLVIAWEKCKEKHADKWILILLLFSCITILVGKGYTFRSGRDYDTVFETRGIMKHGPAAGILTDYMFSYIYNCNYEDFELYLDKDEKVMIVTNMVFSAGTTPYMFQDSEVCHYSIVDPTAYDERLIEYWNMYPEKMPDVIVVDCWYGELQEPSDNFIMTYIEESFGYAEVIDGRYVRFYKK